MPRIRDAYLDCVVYLYPSESDAENGVGIGGTGFLIGMIDKDNGKAFIYAITNRHVVRDGNCVVRMRTKNGKSAVIATDERAWRFHIAGDDLAICMLLFDPRHIKLSVVKLENFLTKEIVSRFNIGPGDETFLVGRFINHEGKQQNQPTARFGCISQMPSDPIIKRDGLSKESFLVETRAIGGYSGSPVFVYIPFGSERENVDGWAPGSDAADARNWSSDFGVLQSHGPWLLGVDWGYINDWKPVCGPSERPTNPSNPRGMQVELNTGMMTVVPAWKLHELLFSEDVVRDRAAFASQLNQYKSSDLP